jgi:hypothetical protein
MTTISVPADVDPPGSAAPPGLSDADPAAVRLARLRRSVHGLGRGRRLGGDLERLLLIAGGVLIPLGVALIIAGWYGAAHTPRLFEQIPYAISGGILGGSLVIAGGFFYFGFWLTKLVHEGRQQAAAFTAAVTQLEARLVQQAEARTLESDNGEGRRAVPARGRTRSRAAAGGGPALVATATGTMLHKPDCPVVVGKDGLRRLPADAAGFKPCRICEPLG